MWNFKGTLWNSTQNILLIHWKMRFLYNIGILRALRFKSSYAFLKRPPGIIATIISQVNHQSSSTFSASNISSKIIWLHQLHDTNQMKSHYTLKSHMMIYNGVWNLIFGTKFSSINLARGEKRLIFRLSFVNLQRAKDGTRVWCKI